MSINNTAERITKV